jgi:hypothetical protein
MSLSFFKKRPESQIEDLLMAHAEALLAGTLDLDKLMEQYDEVSWNQVASLFALAERINRSLVTVKASDQFVDQLRRQLVGASALDHRSLWARLRAMPPRKQLAAGIGGVTLTAGVFFIASRSVPDALDYVRHRMTA